MSTSPADTGIVLVLLMRGVFCFWWSSAARPGACLSAPMYHIPIIIS